LAVIYLPYLAARLLKRRIMATYTYDLVDLLLDYESGELDTIGFLELFAELVGTGQAWVLHDFYEWVAIDLIERGYITPEGTITMEGYEAAGEA
jgi:hypothetical protein